MADFLHKYLRLPYRLTVTEQVHGTPIRTVVFIHGIAASGAMWQHTIDRLENTRCLTVDLIGFGASPKPDFLSYDLRDHVRMLHYTLGKYHLAHPAIIVGHSLGSLVAIEYQRRYPRDFDQLILCAPPLYATQSEVATTSRLSLSGQRAISLLNFYRQVRQQEQMTITALQRAKLLLPIAKTMTIDETTWTSFKKTLENSIETQTTLADIARLTVPTTIIYGTNDPVVIPAYIKIAAASNPRVTAVRLLGGTHLLDKRYREAIKKALISH